MVLISVVFHLITPWNTIWNSGFHHKHQPKDSQMITCYFITENECLPNNNNNNNSKMMKNSQADVSNKICIQSSLRQFFSKNTCLNMWKNLWGVILPNCDQWSLMLLSSRGSHWLRCSQQSFSHSTNIKARYMYHTDVSVNHIEIQLYKSSLPCNSGLNSLFWTPNGPEVQWLF